MRRAGAAVAVVGALVLGGAAPTTDAGPTAVVHAPATYAGPTVVASAPAASDGIAAWSLDLDTGPGTTTSPQVSTSPFTLVALSWDAVAPTPTHLELRVREGAGWSTWFDLAVDRTTSPDNRLATEPFIADGSDGAQAHIVAEGGLPGLRLDFVHVADAPARVASALTASAKQATGSELQPKIVTRAEWGANEKKTKQASSSTWLKAMYVHHTAGPNAYSRERAPAVVRSIWAFHTSGRGWPDIGYQFLVDRFGTVYEGRRGSIDALPVGAQAGGFNADTIGVSVMGNFTSVAPPPRVLDAVVDVLAWQAHRWGVDPRGKARLRTATSTGSEPRWALGKLSPALPVIRGHRDTNHTACPGAKLYAKLPAIRRAVDAKVTRAERRFGTTPAQLAAPRAAPLAESSSPVTLASAVTVSWQEVDGAARYQVLKRSAKHGKDVDQTKYAWFEVKDTRRTSTRIKIPRGQTWTIAVRALDDLGRPGKVRTVGTTTRPVAAKHVERTGRWSTARRPAYYGRVAHVSRERGAALVVRKAVDAQAVWLVAATGPTRGRVAVFAGSKRVATVSLSARTPQSRALVEVRLPKSFSGTIRLRALDRTTPVRISAVALERAPLT